MILVNADIIKNMSRYNPTERIGVNETEKIVIQNLGWIFREQPIVDVGLDAIIEIVENDEPTGKFIAVQIKTGSGNFYKTEKGLSHYVTNIHYNYWLDLCIPIILVAHIPEDGKTYWQELTEENFKKNKKKWKLEIPYKQEFSEKSEKRLIKIASDENEKKFDVYRGRVDSNNINDIIEDLNSISDATVCITNITAILNLQTKETQNKTGQLELLNRDKPFNNSSEVLMIYKSLSKTMNLTSKRIETEVELFSQLYSVGITAFEKFLINLNTFNLRFGNLTSETDNVKRVPEKMDFAISEYTNLRKTLINMSISDSVSFKEAKDQQIKVLDLLISELQDASKITKIIFEKL